MRSFVCFFSLAVMCFFHSCTSSFGNGNLPPVTQTEKQPQVGFGKPKVFGSVPDSFDQDPQYAPVLKKWVRDVALYKDLELYFTGSVVLMSPEMQDAYQKRLWQVQGPSAKPDPNVVVQAGYLPVVVTFFSKNYNNMDLEDAKIWNLALLYHGKWISSEGIKRFRTKEPLAPYFPSGSDWSRMYVVLFNVGEEPKIFADDRVVFSMRNGESSSDFVWY